MTYEVGGESQSADARVTQLEADPIDGRDLRGGSVGEVFAAFLKLGLTSFGGPIAHLGYFHREFIERRRWIHEAQYAQLVALCQFLPGPASSQLGFALGLLRAGWLGAFAAFVAFTLPSAVLLFLFARYLPLLEHTLGQAALHGLKLVAVAVVAQGVLLMAQRLTPDASRALIAAAAGAFVAVSGSAAAQLVVVMMGALLGLMFCRNLATPAVSSFNPRYGTRTGALVFGGGHVVLPLLQEAVVEPGWVTTNEFLAGYGAAQAVPGPMFSIAAFLGSRLGEGQAAVGPARAAEEQLLTQAQALFGALTVDVSVDEQQAALGRVLFFDTRIAADGKTGCVTCHLPEHWGADGRAFSPDARGKLTERNSQTVFNAAGQASLRWRGDRRSAAHQAEDSLKGSIGFATADEVVPVLNSLGYAPAFKRAFAADPAPVSPANFGRALEAYQRTLVTPAPFDAYLQMLR